MLNQPSNLMSLAFSGEFVAPRCVHLMRRPILPSPLFLLVMVGVCGAAGQLSAKSTGVFSEGYVFLAEAPKTYIATPTHEAEKTDLQVADEIASRKFREKYGTCGMTKLKESRGGVWIYATYVGYGGVPADDIIVVLPRDRIAVELHDGIGDWAPIRLTRR